MLFTNSKFQILNSKAGFTLVEFVVTASILLIFSFAAVNIIRNQISGNLDGDSQAIVSRLNEAESRAISGLANKNWGIYFNDASSTSHYDLFAGSAYSGAASSTFYLSPYVIFSTPASGTSTSVIFTKLTGEISATTTIVVKLQNDATKIKTITINPSGSVTIQ